jgi:alpha-L-rhamnosidase
MYRVVAGIDTKEEGPGYKQIIIKPTPGGNMTNIEADYNTNYGKVSSHWKIDGGNLLMHVEIPANTTATVYIPTANAAGITEKGVALSSAPGVTMANESAAGYVAVNVGSGTYDFSTAKP